jgi:hypothetical protein
LIITCGRIEEILVLVSPGLVVVIETWLMRVVKDIRHGLALAGGLQGKLVTFKFPTSAIGLLIFPL